MATNKSTTKSDTTQTVSVNGIQVPVELFTKRGSAFLIRFGGLLYLANAMGVFRCETRELSSDDREIIFECKAYLIPNEAYLKKMGYSPDYPLIDMFRQPVVMHGTTSVDNLTNKLIIPFRYVMAETRSVVRALRILTGCSYTAVDECDGNNISDIEASLRDAKAYGVPITSAYELLGNKTETREFMAVSLNTLHKNNAGAKQIINRFLDDKGAIIIDNLKTQDLQALFALCKDFVKEVSPNESP